MAAEGVARQQDRVRRQDEAADADAEAWRRRRRKPERLDGVEGQDADEEQAEVQEIAMDVLQNQRKRSLPQILLTRLADGARRRVGPERLVVRAAIVVAGDAEPARRPQNQQRRRKRKRGGHHAGFGPNQRADCRRRAAANRTATGTGRTRNGPLESRPRGVDDECGKTQKNQQRLEPPCVATCRFPNLRCTNGHAACAIAVTVLGCLAFCKWCLRRTESTFPCGVKREP